MAAGLTPKTCIKQTKKSRPQANKPGGGEVPATRDYMMCRPRKATHSNSHRAPEIGRLSLMAFVLERGAPLWSLLLW